MNEAQATVIAAVLTVLAAVLGVLLGVWLLGGRVRNLEEAIQHTEDLLNSHKTQVEATLSELRQTLTTTVEGIGQLRGAVGEIPTTAPPVQGEEPREWVAWERLRDDWNSIRDELERRAADTAIDGRTRAKYGRIDRRKYYELIDALDADRNLRGQAKDFSTANDLWQQFKNGRRVPSDQILEQMAGLKRRLVQQVA